MRFAGARGWFQAARTGTCRPQPRLLATGSSLNCPLWPVRLRNPPSPFSLPRPPPQVPQLAFMAFNDLQHLATMLLLLGRCYGPQLAAAAGDAPPAADSEATPLMLEDALMLRGAARQLMRTQVGGWWRARRGAAAQVRAGALALQPTRQGVAGGGGGRCGLAQRLPAGHQQQQRPVPSPPSPHTTCPRSSSSSARASRTSCRGWSTCAGWAAPTPRRAWATGAPCSSCCTRCAAWAAPPAKC